MNVYGGNHVDDLRLLIVKATEATSAHKARQQAFGAIVRRFQDMAFGCAYAILGDFQLAEDAAQEAFIVAWRNLDQLRTPEAFPGWFKRIVLTQCNRQTRGKQLDTFSLDTVRELPAPGMDAQAQVEQSELKERVQAAILSLPDHERMVTTLFYINEYSQNEICAFLELPLSTIKKRLFCARKKLRERMLDMVRDTLQARRPSKDDRFVNTVALFNDALESFVAKVRLDRYVLAAILFGSLSHDKVWHKSDIDIMLVGREEIKPRDYYLVENGVNIHAFMVPRSKFKATLEGGLQGSFFHSSFSKSTLLFSHDETIEEWYRDVHHVGSRDIELQLLRFAQGVLITLAKAEKWLYVKNDVTYSFLWIMYTIESLAKIEVTLNGGVVAREVLQQALEVNPPLFNALYFELIHTRKDELTIRRALDRINAYLDEKLPTLFGPVLDYLAAEGGIRTTSELDAYFKKQVQTDSLANIYEWLADKGVIQKVPSPLRLTPKSPVEVDEAAYYYDAESTPRK